MPKKIFLLLICTIFAVEMTMAQPQEKSSFQTIPNLFGEKIGVDLRGNIFVILGSTLHKYDNTGKFLYAYQNKLLGNISHVDLASPMKIMVFYQELGQLIFLDERLVPITEPLSLTDRNYHSITLTGYATSNYIWLYDQLNQDLIKIDLFLNEQSKTHLSLPHLNPSQLIVLGTKNIVLHNPETGILFFDMFGTYLKTISIQTANDIYIDENFIYYLHEGNLHGYHYKKLEETIIPIDIPNIIQALPIHNQWILLTKEGQVFISNL